MVDKPKRRTLLRPNFESLSLPEPASRSASSNSSGHQSSITLLSEGKWVRFSDYMLETVPEDPHIDLDDLYGPGHHRESVFIRPAKGADPEPYLMVDVLDDLVPFLANRFVPLLGEIEELSEAYGASGEDKLPLHSSVEKLATDLVMEGTQKFGPLGVMFTGIQDFYPGKKDCHVHVKLHRGKDKALEQYFGQYLSRKVSLKVYADGNLLPLFRAYREPVYDYFFEALEFSRWTGDFAKIAPDNSPSRTATDVLLRSRPTLLWANGNLDLSLMASSLIDAAYLHVVRRKLAGRPFKICGLEHCDNIFLPHDKRHIFCSPQCASVIRVRNWRIGNKAGKHLGN